jgi:phospholipase C
MSYANCRRTALVTILHCAGLFGGETAAMQSLWKALLFLFLAITGPALAAAPPEHRPELDRIGHIIVVFLENRSFDHLYGLFPGAEGIQDSGFASIQLSAEGLQFATLPAVINNLARLGGIDSRFAAGLPKVPRDSKVGRSATRRMAGLVGFRVGIAQS